ncbi:small conductance calcium-activated potassium channel protein 3-like, partial [Copidosoma floridanum]|uniref:small conductance calcium-activated potassium channel protein 3-like n=1 Tax=Copidosoma floridanum TaxID=29053 RepID=UPI0006C96FC4
MAEGSAEEEQSSTAAPASPPADLRILNTQLSTSYHQQQYQSQQEQQQHLHQQQLRPTPVALLQQQPQHPSMLATAIPHRHSLLPLSMRMDIKSEADMDNSCDVPLNLKSEVNYPNGPQSSDSLLNGRDSM